MLVGWLVPFAVVIVTMMMPCWEAKGINNNQRIMIKSESFSSPLFTSTPGLVIEKFFYHIDFPRGHIGIKSFDVEVVDESGNPVPLSDTYLHHWALIRYYQHQNATDPNATTPYNQLHEPDYIIASNNGVCQPGALPPYYAMGSESRNLSTFLPNPYGIEVGSDAQVPAGYEERWSLNVHAIDTRGAVDKLGCMECRCHLYNITNDRFGRPLRPDYKGGFECCYDQTQCRVSQSYEGEARNLYVRYTVKWVDWDDFIFIPVKVYMFDVTDTWKPLPHSTSGSSSDQHHHCRVEYDVEACSPRNKLNGGECNAIKTSKVIFPESGFLVYAVAHQHIGGTGATFHGEDGRVLCSSSPIYGRGNEEGYVVGMGTCYPQPGSMKINNGEMVTLVSNYDSSQSHTGVMGFFQIIVADKVLKSSIGIGAQKVIGETTTM